MMDAHRLVLILAFLSPCALFAVPSDGWSIQATSQEDYHPATLANGMIGITPGPLSTTAVHTIRYGVVEADTFGNAAEAIVAGINFLDIDILLEDGRRLASADAGAIAGWAQVLHMDTATLETQFAWADALDVRTRIYAARQMEDVAVLEVELRARQDVAFRLASTPTPGPDLGALETQMCYIGRGDAKARLFCASAQTGKGRYRLGSATSFVYEPGKSRKVDIIEPGVAASEVIELRRGETFRVAFVGALCDSGAYTDPQGQAIRHAAYASHMGIDWLRDGHRAQWDRLWQGDIRIAGDPQSQQDVRFALFNLYSFVRAGSGQSIPPYGLSSTGYNGHVFWDAETWMYPPLLMLHPELARSMLDYRFARLQAARQKARVHGYAGAMFPWESSVSGEEDTPVWAMMGPLEHHVTADVGLAAWQYYCVTQEREWLHQRGFPLMREASAFWLSRVTPNSSGELEILNVVCADEYAEGVDNNAFTNAAAIQLLRATHAAALVLGEEPDPAWLATASRIPVRSFPDGTTREHETYSGETIKQADVNLLTHPLRFVTDPEVMGKNLDYYAPRVDIGPAMTHSIYAIVAARLGRREQAWHYFQDGHVPNKRPPFGVLAETQQSHDINFVTGAGAMLQAVLNGFGGLEITPDGIRQTTPMLPDAWESLTITGVEGLGQVEVKQGGSGTGQ